MDFAGFSISPFSPRHPLCEQAPVDVESNILLPPHPHYSEDYWWLAGSVALVLQQCPWYKLQITRTVKVQRKDDVACNGKPSEDAEATRKLAIGSSDGNKTQLPAQLPAHSPEASWILDGGIALLSSTAHKFESLWGSVGVEIVRYVVSRGSMLSVIHDPWAMFAKAAEMNIPDAWINSTLAGLERVNPFIAELENLNI
ncbi:hypothetical protein B0H13DRAFT_2303632 [Mycena leptocephala]|nr:hypothetical protein B0H13DRAFT_2303632 [Mycena leptocephala]